MEKVFRDPIHNLMRFDTEHDQLVIELLNTSEVQRLRQILQMGISSFIFPGATHSRFSHALGVTHLMKQATRHIQQTNQESENHQLQAHLEEHRNLLLASALLHDVGHFPFSHLMEEVLGVSHEDWTIRLLLDPESEIHQVLKHFDGQLPEQTASVIKREFKPSYVVKLISSQLDVDRMDYLLRDSLYTGVGYGKFDLDWLLHNLRIVPLGDDWVVAVNADKGLQVAESYVLARYYMYQQVYHHKIERAAGAMMLKLLQRAKVLLDEGKLAHIPAAVETLLKNPQQLDRNTFMALTDVVIHYAISLWTHEDDEILSDLTKRFLNRRVFKCISITQGHYDTVRPQIETLAEQKGLNPNYYIHFDKAVDNPYKDRYLEPTDKTASVRVYLIDKNGDLQDLTHHSSLIEAIRNRPMSLQRLCYPEELRPDIISLIENSRPEPALDLDA